MSSNISFVNFKLIDDALVSYLPKKSPSTTEVLAELNLICALRNPLSLGIT